MTVSQDEKPEGKKDSDVEMKSDDEALDEIEAGEVTVKEEEDEEGSAVAVCVDMNLVRIVLIASWVAAARPVPANDDESFVGRRRSTTSGRRVLGRRRGRGRSGQPTAPRYRLGTQSQIQVILVSRSMHTLRFFAFFSVIVSRQPLRT